MLLGARVVNVSDIERPGEVLAELMARSHLKGFGVAHHRFTRRRIDGPGESFAWRLDAGDYRDGQHIDHERLVHVVQDLERIRPGLVFRCVGGVTLLSGIF